MLALTLTALNASRLHQFNIGTDRENALKLVRESFLHGQHSSYVVREEVSAHLNLYLKSVEIINTVNNQHVLWLKLRHLQNNAFNL